MRGFEELEDHVETLVSDAHEKETRVGDKIGLSYPLVVHQCRPKHINRGLHEVRRRVNKIKTFPDKGWSRVVSEQFQKSGIYMSTIVITQYLEVENWPHTNIMKMSQLPAEAGSPVVCFASADFARFFARFFADLATLRRVGG